MRIDLNADMGEGYGPWRMGDDDSLLDIVTSANIACGAHAGDPDVMAATMRRAMRNDVNLGAHPGFADLAGFGRRRIILPASELQALIRFQVGAARGMAEGLGGRLRHLKLHGAMANMAAEDEEMARAAYEAALSVQSDLLIFVMPLTAQQGAAEALGADWAGEVFGDRAYNTDGTLVDRSKPGAVLHDATEMAAKTVRMVKAGALFAPDGTATPARIDTICLHGDTPGAVENARTIRSALEQEGIDVRPV